MTILRMIKIGCSKQSISYYDKTQNVSTYILSRLFCIVSFLFKQFLGPQDKGRAIKGSAS